MDFDWTIFVSLNRFSPIGGFMKKILLLSSLMMVLVSCKEISGTFLVNQDFSANVNKKCGWNPFGSCDPNKKLQIPAGNYNAVIDFGSKTEIKIEMKANAFKETITLLRPKNFEFPTNGDFVLTSVQVNQSFDVKGNVQTTVSESPLQRGNESCTYMAPVWVCSHDSYGRPYCHYENQSVWGYRFVEYYNRNTTRELSADLMQSQRSLARFTGARTDSEKIYTYTSICR